MNALARFVRSLTGWETRVEGKIDRLIAMGETQMGQLEDFADRLNKVTNVIAADLKADRDAINAAIAASQPPDPKTLARLDGYISQLEAMGANPANPVPSVPATPPDPVAPAPTPAAPPVTPPTT